MKKQKVALFHPWLKSKGGAEKTVLEILEKSKHKVELYTWVYDKENTFSEFEKYKINIIAPKFAQKFSRFHILRGLFLIFSFFGKIPLENYDKFLISTSGVGEFITFRNYKKGETFAYVYTPLREASKKIIDWNLKNRKMNILKKIAYLFAIKVYLALEKLSWKRLDYVIFISQLSKSRAEDRGLVNNKEVVIIYPPVDFSRFKNLKLTNGKTFLYYSRLNPPKRQDILLKSWKKFIIDNPSYNLVIAGNIDNKEYFNRLVDLKNESKNIEIKTNISNKELENLISSCAAGLFLGYEEDFGIVPFEILASGKPLLAVDKGGYYDLIKDHKNFIPISEKHNNEEMTTEVYNALCKFIKRSKEIKKGEGRILLNNFIKDLDNFLEKN